nr:hypothetical protein [Tanacetum cinerariifolium]
MLTKPQFFYDHSTRQALGFQNPCYLKKAQQLEPMLYDCSVILKTDAIMIRDSEETLMLKDESRSKMLKKQKDSMMSEKKVNTKPNSGNSEEPNLSTSTTIVEVPKMELYMLNRQHGRMILEFIENGPLLWPTVEENGVTRPKKYSKLSAMEYTKLKRKRDDAWFKDK